MGVGVGAVAFHASSGKARHWGRKLDYWVILRHRCGLHIDLYYPVRFRHVFLMKAVILRNLQSRYMRYIQQLCVWHVSDF